MRKLKFLLLCSVLLGATTKTNAQWFKDPDEVKIHWFSNGASADRHDDDPDEPDPTGHETPTGNGIGICVALAGGYLLVTRKKENV